MNQWRFKCACMNLIYLFHISSCDRYTFDPFISIQPYSQTTCFGENATFQCGGAGHHIPWYIDGKNAAYMTYEEKTERGLVLNFSDSGVYDSNGRRLVTPCDAVNSFMTLAGNCLNDNSKIYCAIQGDYDCYGSEMSDTVTLTVEGCDGGTSFSPSNASVSNTITSNMSTSMKNQHNSTTDTTTPTMLTDSAQHSNTVIVAISVVPDLLLLLIIVVVVVILAVVIRKKANRRRSPGNDSDNTIPVEKNSAYEEIKVNDKSDNKMLKNSQGEDSSGNINEAISEDKRPYVF